MTNNNVDVLVVGAGIVGSSTTYHLAEQGVSVALVERSHPAGGPTGRSSALIHAFYVMPELSQLAIRGAELFKALPEIAGQGSYFTEVGMMWVCDQENAPTWTASVERIRGEGADLHLLSPEDFAKAAPGFTIDDVALAIWEPEYGYVDAYGATNAFAHAAKARGAQVMQNSEVAGLARQGDRVTGVTLADGSTLSAGVVVLAAGPWTLRLLRTAGLELPLHVERHVITVIEAEGRAREVVPFSWCDDILCKYARPDGDQVVLIGSWAGGGTSVRHESEGRPSQVEEPDRYKEGVEETESVGIIETFAQRVPAIRDLGIRPGYAGLYDMSPDDLPVLGPLPGVDGLIVAAGSSGHGFKTGPAVGEALSRLATGTPQAILDAFSPARFNATQ